MSAKMILLSNTGLMLRFLMVGLINTAFGISVYWLLLYTGLFYPWASLLSLLLGIVFSFNSHKLAVFKTEGRIARYVLVWVFIYLVNIELISMIREDTGDYFAGIAVLPVNVVLSFILMKRFVFRPIKEYGVS